MLEFFVSNEENRVVKVNDIQQDCWIHLTCPIYAEIQRVSHQLNIPEDFFRDALDNDERSRIEKENNSVLIIVNFPHLTHDDANTPSFETIPLGIILADDCIITVSSAESPILEDFKNNKMRGLMTNQKVRFSFQLLFSISDYYLRYLKQINHRTNEMERELSKSMKNKEIFSFLGLEKSLVYFTTSLKSNKIVLEKMLRLNYLKMNEDDKDLLVDVIIENQQAIEMTETYSSILSGMMDAFASVISNNLNIVMKFLTSITIILAIPSIVSSLYGMNVDLPFQDKPYAFAIIIALIILLSGLITLLFWRKRFF